MRLVRLLITVMLSADLATVLTFAYTAAGQQNYHHTVRLERPIPAQLAPWYRQIGPAPCGKVSVGAPLVYGQHCQ